MTHIAYVTHQIKAHTPYRFVALFGIFVAYFLYVSLKFDFATGGLVSALAWSFFVLCTPVADAGFLLDFPIRLLFGLRMFVTELLVWGLAVVINLVMLGVAPGVYETTPLTQILFKILTNPIPYWGIVVLCAIGTFLSVYFGDEVMDKVTHRGERVPHHLSFSLRLVVMGAVMALVLSVYYRFANELGLGDLIG